MAPRFKHSFSSLCTVILKQPKGVPYSEFLGHHSEGLLKYDGTTWSLHPRIIDEEKYQVAYQAAITKKQSWRPEDAERFRNIVGSPHCSHTNSMEFIALLKKVDNSQNYWIDDSTEHPLTKQPTASIIENSGSPSPRLLGIGLLCLVAILILLFIVYFPGK